MPKLTRRDLTPKTGNGTERFPCRQPNEQLANVRESCFIQAK
jgi:hypothetical protein